MGSAVFSGTPATEIVFRLKEMTERNEIIVVEKLCFVFLHFGANLFLKPRAFGVEILGVFS